MINVTAVMAEAGVSLKQGVGLTGADIGSMIGLQAPEGFGLAPSTQLLICSRRYGPAHGTCRFDDAGT